jgi:hypothetical protein
MSHSANPAA